MSTSVPKDCITCKLGQHLGLKPINKSTLVSFYVPAFGLFNYYTLSVNVMNPGLLMRIFPSRDVTNVLLLNSMIGSALYIYNSPHMLKAKKETRLLYSGYNALMFNFGSVLIWAVLRSFSPRRTCIATIMGVISGVALVTAGRTCLTYLDTKIE